MTTLLDVWNAGTRFASQALDLASQEKKYVQDVDLFNASMDLEERRVQIAKARETIYDDGGINYQHNPDYPQEFKQYLAREMQEWKQTWGQKYRASRYFSDNLQEIEARGGATLNQTLAEAEITYARQRVNVTYADELNTIDNNPNLDAGEKRSLMLELTERTRGAAGWDETTYEEHKKAVLANSLQEELDYTAGAGIPVADIRQRYDALITDGLKPGNAETGEEAGIYAVLPGAKEAIAVGRDAAVASQQAYNFQQLRELDTAYDVARRNYSTAVASGEPARVNEAYREMMNAYYVGKPKQQGALGKESAEFNPDNRLQIMAMFEDPPGMAEPDAGSALSNQDVYIELLTRWAKGQYSGPEAHKLLVDHMTEQLITTGKLEDGYLIDLFFNDLSKGIEKINPQWNTDVLSPVKALLQSLQKESGLDEGAIALINTKVANGLIDMVGDVGLGTYTTEQWIAKGQDMARIAAGMVIDNLRVTNEGDSTIKGLEGIGSPGAMLQLYQDLEAHPELLYQNAAGQTGSLINQRTLDDIQKQALVDIGAILGEDETNLLAEWENEGAADIKPIPQIRVGAGKNQGIYKYQVNDAGDGLDLRKYNEGTGAWEVYRTGTADQILREDNRTIIQESKQGAYRDIISNMVKYKNVRIDPSFRPPDNAFYIEGYHPRTLAPLTEIPRDIAEAIQRSSTPARWEEIRRAWNEKGIRIGTQNSSSRRRP